MSITELAKRYDIQDPQAAIDRWHTRLNTGRSSLSTNITESISSGKIKLPRKKKTAILNDTPKGLRDGKDVLGYIGVIGTEPVTLDGDLVMYSFRRGAYVRMKEPR